MSRTHSKWVGPWVDRAFWPYLLTLVRVTSWKVVLALGLMVGLSLIEGVGLVMLVPLLALVGLDVQQGALGPIAQGLSSLFTAVGLRPTLVTVLAVFVFITSVQGLVSRWQASVDSTLQHDFVAALRQRMHRAITKTTWLFLCRSRASDFTQILTTEMDRVGAATYYLLHLVAGALVTSVYVFFALRLSPAMTGLVFACGGGLMLVLHGKTRRARLAGEELSQAMNRLYAVVTEHLGAMKTVKSYGAEGRHADLFARLTERVRRIYILAGRNQADVKVWFDISSAVVLSFAVYVSFALLALPTAEVLLLLFLFARLMPRFSGLQQSYQSLVNVLPAFAAIREMQARCEAAAEPRAHSPGKVELHQAIRFDRVSFSYDETLVLRELELTIRAGETTAIVGSSGAGKSTIADLAIGLVVPTEGRVLVDGTPLGPEQMRAWRDQIGYVAQDTFLFHDTVRANLLWVRPDATEAEIVEALRLAAAEQFVSQLPNRLDTVVGDRGVRLSGGERQRLALARALLRRPSLLVLDEATNALDSENEQRIQHAIEALHGAMTILVISHRLSTVQSADIIYVVNDGELIESGSYEALIVQGNGRFAALCRAQSLGDEEHGTSKRIVLPMDS